MTPASSVGPEIDLTAPRASVSVNSSEVTRAHDAHHAATAAVPRSSGQAGMSAVALVRMLWNARRWIILVPFSASVLAAITVLLLPSRYEARTSFTGELGGGLGGFGSLAGLASLAGVSGLGGAMGSADLFAAVAKSESVLRAVLIKEFSAPRLSAQPRRLIDLLDLDATTDAELEAKALEHLSERINVSTDIRTNIVTLTVTLGDSLLAADVANSIVDEVNRFNIERRRSQSGEQRRFAEERLATAEEELRAAERALEDFLRENRSLGASPTLRVMHDRLQRDVALKQEIVSTIRRRYEEARIAEVQDTPVITVIDEARPPHKRAWPKRVITVLVTAFLTGAATVAAVLLQPQWAPVLTEIRRWPRS